MEEMEEIEVDLEGWYKPEDLQSYQPYSEDDWEHLFASVKESSGMDVSDEAEDSSSSSQAGGRAFPNGGANQHQQLAPQAVQASHEQGRPPTQLEDITALRTVVLSTAYTLTISETTCLD